MCVIIAKRIKLHKSNKRNWFLYKIRDRVYGPTYNVKFSKKGPIESVFLVDNVNDWTEGVNSAGIMIVSAALQNHADEKDGEENPDPTKPMHVSRNGLILRQCLKMNTIEKVVNTLKDEFFTGSTFISDGDRLFVLECYIKQEAIDRETEAIENIDDIKWASEITQMIMKGIKREDYVVKSVEIKGDIDLVVRTNHGITLPEAGYQKSDEDVVGYKSSHARYNHAYEAIKGLDENTHPFEVLTIIKNLGSDDVDKDPKMRPIRIKGPTEFFSGCVVMLTPTGTLFVVPLECEFEDVDFDKLNADRKVSIVILPRNLPLFEGSRRSFAEYNKIKDYETFLM